MCYRFLNVSLFRSSCLFYYNGNLLVTLFLPLFSRTRKIKILCCFAEDNNMALFNIKLKIQKQMRDC